MTAPNSTMPVTQIVDDQGQLAVFGGASGSAASAIVPVKALGAFSLVVKSAAGNLYSASMTAGATAGFFIAYDAAVPAANGAIDPLKIVNVAQIAANGTANFGGNVAADRFTSAISLLFSTNLATFVAPANAAQFMRGSAI